MIDIFGIKAKKTIDNLTSYIRVQDHVILSAKDYITLLEQNNQRLQQRLSFYEDINGFKPVDFPNSRKDF